MDKDRSISRQVQSSKEIGNRIKQLVNVQWTIPMGIALTEFIEIQIKMVTELTFLTLELNTKATSKTINLMAKV